jgi:hypothetical protein
MWTRYFHSKGLNFLFWSANYEKLKQEARDAELKRLEDEEAGIVDVESKPAVRHRQPRQPQPEDNSEDEEPETEAEADEGPLSNDEAEGDDDAADDGVEEADHDDEAQAADETATTTTTPAADEAEAGGEEPKADESDEEEEEDDGLSEEEVERLAKVHGIDELLEHILAYSPPKESTSLPIGSVLLWSASSSSDTRLSCVATRRGWRYHCGHGGLPQRG